MPTIVPRVAGRTAGFLLPVLLCACGDDPLGSGFTLLGEWDLVGFSDAGVPAATSGSAIFRSDGTFSIAGTVTFPGEPPDPVSIEGTYEESETDVRFVVGFETSTWTLDVAGVEVTLTEVEPPPRNTLTLRRRQGG